MWGLWLGVLSPRMGHQAKLISLVDAVCLMVFQVSGGRVERKVKF